MVASANRRKREMLVSGPSGVHTRDNPSKVHKPMGVPETDTPPKGCSGSRPQQVQN